MHAIICFKILTRYINLISYLIQCTVLIRMFDLTTVGHFAIDLISSPKIASPRLTLGGPPTYASLAARKLGSKVSVISKAGEDFTREYVSWLKSEGVNLSGLRLVKGAVSTRFILKYRNGGRKLQLKGQAPPISPEDVPNTLRTRAIHVAPITNEVSLEAVEKLRTLTNTLSLDPRDFCGDLMNKGMCIQRSVRNKKFLVRSMYTSRRLTKSR